MEEIVVRPMQESDFNFVLSTWLRQYLADSWFPANIARDIYFEFHQKAIERILFRKGAKVLVASLRDDPYIIIGYFAFERTKDYEIAHYLYVKGAFRRMGIGTLLFNASFLPTEGKVSFTHRVKEMRWLFDKHPNLTYNPYLI